MKSLDSDFLAEKNKLQSSATIDLYEISLDGTPLRFAAWREDVVFNGDTYVSFPIVRNEYTESEDDVLPQIQLTIANVSRVIGGYLESYNGLIGKTVTHRTVFENLLSDPNAVVEETYYVKSSVANQDAVVLVLASRLDIFNASLPARRFQKNFCPWTYKGEGCWIPIGAAEYEAPAGFVDTENCDHSLDGVSGCEFHANEKRYGGFFGIPEDVRVLRI